MTKYFYLFVLIVIATMANAQTTQDAKDYINTNIVTNGTKSITASKLNTALNKIIDAIDSSIVYVDSNAVVVSSIDSTYYTVLNYTNTPPSSPITGAIYAIGNSPTGAWIGHAKEIAIWNGSAWSYIAPEQGDFFFNITNDYTYQYRNGSWVRVGGIPLLHNGNTITGGVIVGTNNNASLTFETNNVNRGRFDSIGRLHIYNLPTSSTSDTFVTKSDLSGKLTKVGQSTFLSGVNTSLFPNGVKVITESRTLQADDAGYVLMLESPDSATQVVLTIPTPSPLNVGDNFGIIVSDGNDNANNGWIDEEGSPIRPFRGAITLFTTTSFEGNNVIIPVNSPQVEDGVNKSTVTRYLYDKVIVLGDRVDVLENRDFITKTKYEIDGLISTNALVKGATYKITGVHPTLYNDGTNSGTTILLKAISENVLETQGTGIFYNPKYNQAVAGFGIWDNKMYGTFSTIVGNFDYENKETVTADNSATGILLADGMIQYVSGNWSSATSITGDTSSATANVADFVSPSYAVNDKVIWGGYSWTNVNGNIGASTNVLNLNAEWTKDVYDTTNYNVAYDLIEYDYANNWISRRYEVKSNVDVRITNSNYSLLAGNYSLIYSAISVQQFGNPYNSSTNKGILNKYIDNACDESINFSGSRQRNLTFAQNSFQQYITFGQNSKQESLTFAQSSSQRNIAFGQGSYQYNLTFGQSSGQYNLTFGQGSQQRNIAFGQNSYQQNIAFGQNSFQQYITFAQDSKQQNLTFAQNSYQQNIAFGQYSQVDFNNQILYSNMVFSDFKTKNFTVPDLSSATYIFGGYIKEVYQRPDGTIKLKFMNNSDVLEVHGIAD